jgi:hypothetical protein
MNLGIDSLAERGGVDDVAEDHRHGLPGGHVLSLGGLAESA